jgi:hypothetical protein
VLARANAAIERLDRRLVQAQRAGDPGFFNKTYKLRRQQAQAEDRPFMPLYGGTGPVAARARRRRGGRSAWDRRACVRRRRCLPPGDQSDVAPKYNMQYPSQALYRAEYRG